MAYLNPSITFYFASEKADNQIMEKYNFPNGLNDYMADATKNKVLIGDIINIEEKIENDLINIAFAYTDSYSHHITAFCNNIATEEGGDHLTSFKNSLKKAIVDYSIEKKMIKENQKIELDDILEGLTAIISVKVSRAPQFEGQSKSKLKMPEIKKPIKEAVEKEMFRYLDKHPNEAKAIIDKISQATKAREAARKARDNVRVQKEINSLVNPGKLADCSSNDPAESEIYFVEGDSAGGSAKQARNRRTQAVLPVFGKILNAEKKRFDDIINSEKIKMILGALRCKIDKNGKIDISKLRYHYIVIMTDADVDGYHIQTLYLTFFYRYLREVIENGYLYIAKPPLYKLSKGKKIIYAYSDQERDELKKEFDGDPEIQRYKGLGEMDADQLWETTMNPETRTLIQVTLENAEAAEEMVDIAMGKKTSTRYQYIKENSENITL